MIDEKLNELNLMLIVDRKFWFPLRVPYWACILDAGSWGRELMVQRQAEARKARSQGDAHRAADLNATVEEIRGWLVRRSGLVATVPDLAARQRINPQAIRGEKNMRRYIHRLLDIAKPAPLGAAMNVLLLADLEGDTVRLHSAVPGIARHAGQYVQGEEISQERLRAIACAAMREAVIGRSIHGKGDKYGN